MNLLDPLHTLCEYQDIAFLAVVDQVCGKLLLVTVFVDSADQSHIQLYNVHLHIQERSLTAVSASEVIQCDLASGPADGLHFEFHITAANGLSLRDLHDNTFQKIRIFPDQFIHAIRVKRYIGNGIDEDMAVGWYFSLVSKKPP